MSIKTQRLGNIMQEELGKIIDYELKDDTIKFVTISSVDISADLSYAKVYFTTLSDRDETLKALNKASKYIRGLVAQRVIIRKMPEITFVYDDSIEYAKKIEDIIERINEDE